MSEGWTCLRLGYSRFQTVNGCNDRETGGYTAVDYVLYAVAFIFISPCTLTSMCSSAVHNTLNRHDCQTQRHSAPAAEYPISAFITHLVYLKDAPLDVDELALTALGVKPIAVSSQKRSKDGKVLYDAGTVKDALQRILQPDQELAV